MSDNLNRPIGRSPVVICLGLSALDYIWTVDRLPQADAAKARAHAFATKGGGMAATAAATVARLGGDARFWGRAGNDPEGRLLREQLNAEGVGTKHFRLFDGGRSSISGVFVDAAGERHICNFRGAGLPKSADWLPLDEISNADVVLSDPRWPEGTCAAFAAARERGVVTVLDADVADAEVFRRILPLTDHAIFSAPALTAFAGPDLPAALCRIEETFGCAVSAVTMGHEGVAWREHGKPNHLPAFKVDVVDTTGAGDVFHGAYAFAVARSCGVAGAMNFASAAAALKCTKPDGRSGIPSLDEIIDFQRKNP